MNLEQLLQSVSQSSPEEITDILQACMERYRTLFPNDEILYLALPKNDPKERKRLLKIIRKMV